MKIKCTRGFGRVENPIDGSDLDVQDPIDGDSTLLEALQEEYGEHTFVKGEPHPSGSEDANAEPTCGVNGCKRKVDDPEDTCWQH